MALSPRFRRALCTAGSVVPSLLAAQWDAPPQAASAQPVVPLTGLQHVVITGAEIRRRNVRTLDVLFEGAIPGIIAVGPGTTRSTIWRSRGLVSPSIAATPRVYLNGVEVTASSVASIAPDVVDSVVAYPGTAAGAFAGPGSSGGVVYVYTERGRKSAPPTLSGKTSGGMDRSLYGKGSPHFQDHVVALSGGDSTTTYYVGGGLTSEGEWAPSYSDRLRHGLASLTTSGRYGTLSVFGLRRRETMTPAEPLATSGLTGATYANSDTSRVNAYGASVALAPRPWWTLDASGGVYDDEWSGASAREMVGFPQDTTFSASDTARRRTSYTAATTVRLPRLARLQPLLLGGFERTRVRYEVHDSIAQSLGGSASSRQRVDPVYQGYSAALGLRAGDVFSLTAGARREILVGVGVVDKAVWRPRFDAALALPTPLGRATLRGAYGRVAPRYVPGEPVAGPSFAPITPSEQKGYEGGFDLVGVSRGAGVTLFKQEGHDRQVVPIAPSVSMPMPGTVIRDAGMVTNTGTSAYAYMSRGPVSARAEYSTVRSRAHEIDSVFVNNTYDPDAQLNAFPNAAGHAAVIYTTTSGATLSTDARYAGSYRNRDFRTAGAPFTRYPAFVTYDLNASFPLADAESFIVYVHNVTNVERYDAANGDYARGRRLGVGVRFGVR